ncbi:DNA polymerase I [Hathewaya histolytica]|uniref:DNA polymerase I n=2 Tax=Hathewaya histolytica TaxID=1498 RepID=A0A4U9R7D9_HATHI|nr:DNA polymerase I [Hathewaya histolytica]VTQ87385.1 DNA polymerase I [Hathewaya histolytica]
MDREKLVVLDGNSLMYRAFFAMPDLTNSEGLHTNAIYGFINMLLKIKSEFKPDHIVATFDKKAPTFRHKEYDEYKAGRKKMPEELREQTPFLREFLQKYAVNIFEIDGYEADDLIGTLSVYAEENNMEVYIVTGDRDALQLATDNVKIVINKKGISEIEVYDRERIIKDMGVTPKEFIDVKGLMGDKSDNIKGVPGIGEKTAYKLIKEYKSIENLLLNIENISGKKVKENLMEYREQAILSKRLATIITSVPIEINLDEIRSKSDLDLKGIEELFSRLQFKSLIKKLPEISDIPMQSEQSEKQEESGNKHRELLDLTKYNIKLIDTYKDLDSLNLSGEVYFIYSMENENILSKMEMTSVTILNGNNIYSINYKDIKEEAGEKAKDLLKVLCSDKVKLIGHGVKSFYTFIRKNNLDPKTVDFDTEIAAYLIDPGKKGYELKSLQESLFHVNFEEQEELFKIVYLKELYNVFKERILELDMKELFYEVEIPLTFVISSMEFDGFRVDKEILNELGDKFTKEIILVEEEIFSLSGEKFNIKSPKQLGKILFEKLDLPAIKKTKTGYSTNAEVLEALKDKHEIIEKIIYHRQLTKLYSTYVEGLRNVIDEDGKIHSNFNQTITTTGRLSSTEPNLQNIPIKYAMGREIRKVFIPEEDGNLILSADYSQIELRVLAHISSDEKLIEAFKNHSDIHRKTASEVFKVPIEEVTPIMRSNAKAVNFGIVYGIGDFSLAKDLNISRKEARTYIDTYFDRYPKVKHYLDNSIYEAKENLMVRTILNRRRFIPEIGSSKKMIVSLGERLAMNTPIQGSAADIIKLAMVKVYNELKNRNLKSKLILQVHDELIVNVDESELEEVKSIVKNNMEDAIKLSVPLEVDINVGNNWYESK